MDEFLKDIALNGIMYDQFREEALARLTDFVEELNEIAIVGKLDEKSMRLAIRSVFDEALNDKVID